MSAATGRRHSRRAKQGLAGRPARVEPLPAAEHGEARHAWSGKATSEARQERRSHRCVIPVQHQATSRTLFHTFSGVPVTTVSATEARRRLYALIDEVGQSHQPVQIHGKRGNAVLLSEADWSSIQETLHLLAIPGMRESILEGIGLPPVSRTSP